VGKSGRSHSASGHRNGSHPNPGKQHSSVKKPRLLPVDPKDKRIESLIETALSHIPGGRGSGRRRRYFKKDIVNGRPLRPDVAECLPPHILKKINELQTVGI